jgi:quinol monooxygenase YgiN
MFARIVEFTPKLEKKEELVKVIRNDVLPILKKQTGFMEILPFFPETKNEKVVVVSLWMEQRNAERYEREAFPKVEEILQPYLTTPITFKSYKVETTLCEHFVQALAA